MRVLIVALLVAISYAQTGLCTQQSVGVDSVTNEICENSDTACEVYMKKGTLNGVNVVTGDDYCRAIGLTCLQMFDDNDGCTPRGTQYATCSNDGGSSSDHIVRCGSTLVSPYFTVANVAYDGFDIVPYWFASGTWSYIVTAKLFTPTASDVSNGNGICSGTFTASGTASQIVSCSIPGTYNVWASYDSASGEALITQWQEITIPIPGACELQNVAIDDVTKEICENSPSVCEAYIKKGPLNGVNVVTGNDYCQAIGMKCLQMFDDQNSCARGDEYGSCDADGDGSSDHVVRCGIITTSPTAEPTKVPSKTPTKGPTAAPTVAPTKVPTTAPTDPCFHITCTPLTQCHVAGECSNGVCTNPFAAAGVSCNDENPLTKDDQCDGKGVCSGTNIRTPLSADTSGKVVSGSSHGDPIIHTFKNDCYDLNKDGLYVASSHPDWTHDVKVAVYNDYIREIQITDFEGEILMSISNLQETTGSWPYGYKFRSRMCAEMTKECEFMHAQFTFDAQLFKYEVQILFHDYLDPALKDGEKGVHLDIYPKVYEIMKANFNPDEFEGIYFDNPLPEDLPFCPADSPRRQRV